jgi:WD40 repeat protein
MLTLVLSSFAACSYAITFNLPLAGARLFRIGSCQTAVLCLMYISFGTMLASGGRDGSIKIWDATTGAGLSEVISAHSDSVRGMACDSSGQLLVTASADMSVKVWKQV